LPAFKKSDLIHAGLKVPPMDNNWQDYVVVDMDSSKQLFLMEIDG